MCYYGYASRDASVVAWLTLWDPVHGNLQGAQEIHFEPSEDMVINPITADERVVQVSHGEGRTAQCSFERSAHVQIAVSADSSYIVVALEHHVAVCPLYCPQPSLGLLLNKMKSTLAFAEEGVAQAYL